MSERLPISDFIKSITYINPDTLQEEGIDAFSKRIENAYNDFTEFVWGELPHNDGDEMPSVLEKPCIEKERSIQQETDDAKDSLETLGIDDNLHDSILLNNEDSLISASLNNLSSVIQGVPITTDILEPYHVDKLSKEQMNQVMEAAIDTCHQYAAMMNLFLQRVAEICADSQAIDIKTILGEPTEQITAYFRGVKRDKAYLSKVCTKLIDNYWLDKETDVNDFIYFFSGDGYPPYKRLRWMESSVLLSIFLKEFTTSNRLWKIASKVFLVPSRKDEKYYPVDADKIRCNYSCAQVAEIYPDNLRQVKEMLSVE